MDDQTEAKKIRAALRQTRGTREYARVVAVNMVRVKKFAASATADALGVDRSTVSDWLDAYDREGLDGLADDARPGRPPLVQRAELERIVDGARRFTAYEFVDLVKKKTGVKYSEPHGRRLLRSLGFVVKKTPRISDRVPPKEDLEIWQKDIKKEVEMLENNGFTLVMADESHQNSNIFGSGAVYVRGDAEPIQMPLGNQRQTVYGGVTLDGQTCYMAADRANDRSFIRYLDKLQRHFGKIAVVADNAAYHNSGRVRRHLEKNDNFVKLTFLPPYSPFLNPVEWLWRSGKMKIRRIFRRPARIYLRRRVMLVYESLEITFDPRNILFRDLGRILPA